MPAGTRRPVVSEPGGAGECLADLGGDGVRGGLGECGERAEQMAGCSKECGDAQVSEHLRGAAAGAALGEPVSLLARATKARGEEGKDKEGDERVKAWGAQEVEAGGAGRAREAGDPVLAREAGRGMHAGLG